MSVPGFQSTFLPILRFTADGQPHRAADTLAYVVTQFPLTAAELEDRLPNGRTRILDRVLWAVTYLRQAGLLESVSRGVFMITERGRALLAEKPKTLGTKDLERYPEFIGFKGRGRTGSKGIEAENPAAQQQTPEEELERTFLAIRKRWRWNYSTQ